ncbi:MAG: hypothetical protein NC078_04405 [Ruminococcus sp.]|nr:hypothetical protein [Ruminococcus sp.]
MSDDEFCLYLEMLLALLDTGNTDKAREILRNGIKRIDRGYTSSSKEDEKEEE